MVARRSPGLTLILFAGLACGEGTSEPATVSISDACTLATAAEVEGLLGAPAPGVAESSSVAGATSRRCTWERKYTTVLRTDSIVLSVAPVAAYTPLTGSSPYAIGDGGELVDQPRGVQMVWKHGRYAVTFRYAILGALSEDFEPYRTKAKALARSVDSRL